MDDIFGSAGQLDDPEEYQDSEDNPELHRGPPRSLKSSYSSDMDQDTIYFDTVAAPADVPADRNARLPPATNSAKAEKLPPVARRYFPETWLWRSASAKYAYACPLLRRPLGPESSALQSIFLFYWRPAISRCCRTPHSAHSRPRC